MTTTKSYTAKASNVEEAEELIVDFLGSALPETLRIMNSGAICESCELGEDVYADDLPDSEAPADEHYELYEKALESLHEKGKVFRKSVFEMDVYHLSPEEQDKAIATKAA